MDNFLRFNHSTQKPAVCIAGFCVPYLRGRDSLPQGISPQREIKNRAFYKKIKNFFGKYKLTKNLNNLIVVEEKKAPEGISIFTVTSTTIITPKKTSSYQGKIIRNIVITTLDPFGFDERDLSKSPHTRLERYGNALHIKTRESTVRRMLLFKKDNIDRSSARPQILWFLDKYGDLDMPTQYATVWNNGLPGMLVDSYNPDKKSNLLFAAYDGRYAVFNQLVYNPSTSPFTHEQLRNTIEYFDSNNNPEFKAKKHRLFPDERIIRIYEY